MCGLLRVIYVLITGDATRCWSNINLSGNLTSLCRVLMWCEQPAVSGRPDLASVANIIRNNAVVFSVITYRPSCIRCSNRQCHRCQVFWNKKRVFDVFFYFHKSQRFVLITRKPCYRKDDRTMRPIYKLFTLILFTLTATILCANFDSERI